MHIITIGIIILCAIIWLIGVICEWIGSLFKEKPKPPPPPMSDKFKREITPTDPVDWERRMGEWNNRNKPKPKPKPKAKSVKVKTPPPKPENDMDFF